MKRWIAPALAVLLLVGCASIPAPQGTQSSLVVGSLTIDFPDGFYGFVPRTLETLIHLKFTDLTTNEQLAVDTGSGGYYYFVGVPGHKYRFDSCVASRQEGNEFYAVGPLKMDVDFLAVPGKINYLTNLVISYRSPKREASGSDQLSTWHYDITSSSSLKLFGVYNYISRKQKDSEWLTYKILPVKFTRDKNK